LRADSAAVSEALGARDGEDNLAAAKRVVTQQADDLRKLRADWSEHMEERLTHDRKALRQALSALNMERDAARKTRDAAYKERDSAIESRAQMQAKLVAVERERDAAQEEAKALRVGRAEDVRPLHDSATYAAMRAGVPMWMCLMTGPCKTGGRWSLETCNGDLRMRWPSLVVQVLNDTGVKD
jgi:hypothetical protein